MFPHGWTTRKMQSASAPNAISTNVQPKLRITQPSVVDMTEPRFSGASSPQPTKLAMRTAEPRKTAGSTPLRKRFTAAPG
jgi:hypothetical protein